MTEDYKKQHYLSRCYLKGFTGTDKKNLTILDLKSGKLFQKGPNSVGYEDYFNRYEIAGVF